MINSTSEQKGLPPLKRILVLGNGGRENSLAWALANCKGIEKVWIAPGNGGTEEISTCKRLEIEDSDNEGLIHICKSHQIDLVVIGPEAPLAAGVADKLREAGLTVFGPGADGARLEASKAWAKNFMVQAEIPTANHWTAKTEEEALLKLFEINKPLVVKADGLAAGKGVTVSSSIEESSQAIKAVFKGKFGIAGNQLVLEEKLSGPEVSIFALCDGKRFVLLPSAQDHKRLMEGDKGPNTGGMGAYAPAPLLNKVQLNEITTLIIQPTLQTLKENGIDYRGVIYVGLMITENGPKVIEYNCRFGDPECQTLMPLMGPELATILQACALGCLDKAPKLSIHSKCSACVVAAASGYPESPEKGAKIKIDFAQNPEIQLFHAGTTCDSEGKLLTSGGRVLAVVAQGKNFDDAFEKAYKSLEDVHFDGIVYRRDIGYQVRSSWS